MSGPAGWNDEADLFGPPTPGRQSSLPAGAVAAARRWGWLAVPVVVAVVVGVRAPALTGELVPLLLAVAGCIGLLVRGRRSR